jgi:hypothetical protein
VKPKTGLLKISRLNEGFGVLRGLEVFINDEKAGSIASGESFEIELVPADYQVYVKMDWCVSQALDFQLEAGQILSLETGLKDSLWGIFNIFANPNDFFFLSKSKRKNDSLY